MDCDCFVIDTTTPIREQMKRMSGDEFDALYILHRRKVVLKSQNIIAPSLLFELHCRDWLLKSQFVDDDIAYKAVPNIMLEFEQYLREVGSGRNS
jgi:hypothetical protein